MLTKKQEQDALNKIVDIISALHNECNNDSDSYVLTAFKGIEYSAQSNIDNDFLQSYYDMYIEQREKAEKLEQELKEQRELCDIYKKQVLSRDDREHIIDAMQQVVNSTTGLKSDYAAAIVANAEQPNGQSFIQAREQYKFATALLEQVNGLIERVRATL